MHTRQRLARILHSKRLSVCYRVRLYVACVRSTLLYGLHAVGYSVEVAKRLEGYDTRALRAIAASPVHLTREPNAALRRRLRVVSPLETLKGTLRRRAVACRSEADRAWFLGMLSQLEAVPENCSLLLVTQDNSETIGVPCNICGQYFLNHRHMRSHRTREHSKTTSDCHPQPKHVSGVLPAEDYRKFSVDGMPTCRFCEARFTRVEGLKKHIKRGCPKYPTPHLTVIKSDPVQTPVSANTERPGVVTVPEVQVASGQGELFRPSALQTTPNGEPLQQPLIQHSEFQATLRDSWKQAVQQQEYCRQLRTYCVFCGQWVSLVGPGCKQHMRTMHKREWTFSAAATARITSLGLDPCSPCRYCLKPVKDPRKHLPCCTPLFQASLAALTLSQETSVPAADGKHGRGCSSNPGTAGDQPGLPGQSSSGGTAEGDSGGPMAGQEAPVECAEGELRMGPVLSELEGQPPHDHAHAGSVAPRSRPSDVEGRHQLCGLHRYFAPLLPSGRGRSRRQMARAFCGGYRHHGAEDDTPDGDPHQAQSVGRGAASRRGEDRTLHGGWLGQGGNDGPGSLLRVSRLGHEAEEAGGFRADADVPDIGSEGPRCGDPPLDAGGRPASVQVHYGADGQHGERGSAVYGHHQPTIEGGGRASSDHASPFRQCLLQTAGDEDQARAWQSRQHESAPGAGVLEPGLLRMEAEEEQSFPGLGLGRPRPEEAAPRAVRLSLSGPLQLPQARLANPAGINVCYANSALQAWYWLRELTDSPESLRGSSQTGQILFQPNTILLTDCWALRSVFRTWPELNRQHDVGEFWQHLVVTWRLDAFAGQWQARVLNPFTIVDRGTLDRPITLPITRHSLQGMLNDWRNQHSIHGIAYSQGVVCVLVERFKADRAKDMQPVSIPPGLRVSLPHFCAPDSGIDVLSVDYHVGFVIFHQGPTIHSGHFQVALSYPDTTKAPVEWKFYVCNDRRCPRPATSRDQKLIDKN